MSKLLFSGVFTSLGFKQPEEEQENASTETETYEKFTELSLMCQKEVENGFDLPRFNDSIDELRNEINIEDFNVEPYTNDDV